MKFCLRLFARILAALPLALALWLGRGVGFFLGDILRFRRREMLRRIAWALPEKSPDECRIILRGMYKNFGMTMVEIFRMAILSPEKAIHLVDDNDFLDARNIVLQQGRGLISITAHLDNWELLAATTALRGTPTAIVVKDLKPPAFDRFITEIRERHRVAVIRRRGSIRTAIRHLRSNGLLGFILDQNTKRDEGIFVDFFGHPACTTQGLAQIAHLTKAPAMVSLLVREPQGHHRAICGKVIPPPDDLSEENVRAYTQEAVHELEKIIRQYPEQWIWMHRRWRTQPLPQVAPNLAASGESNL